MLPWEQADSTPFPVKTRGCDLATGEHGGGYGYGCVQPYQHAQIFLEGRDSPEVQMRMPRISSLRDRSIFPLP